MSERTANLLGALGLAVADRIHAVARDILQRSGETPAALVVIGYGQGPSNDRLRHVLGLSHPGAVRLVDRLVADGLVRREKAEDRRAVALHLTDKGKSVREALLAERLRAVQSVLDPLSAAERDAFGELLHRILQGLPESDLDKRRLCRMCDDRVCTDCPVPADFKAKEEATP